MAVGTQTYSAMTAEQRTFYETALLIRALPNLVHAQWGQQGRSFQIPDRQGMQINWRRTGASR